MSNRAVSIKGVSIKGMQADAMILSYSGKSFLANMFSAVLQYQLFYREQAVQ